ncbi:hypothetical protein SDC9_146819 [bioreactor metagenome]|uniref:Uncharacterized protein n=1 Tax=bioreactor metagenome TaxID=1076179 RepID=A0A645ECC1_9ZZZZ
MIFFAVELAPLKIKQVLGIINIIVIIPVFLKLKKTWPELFQLKGHPAFHTANDKRQVILLEIIFPDSYGLA